MQTIIALLIIIAAAFLALLSRDARAPSVSGDIETTADESWQVWLRKWIGALSPIATLIGAAIAVNYAALPQLELSRETSRRQLRAYVVVSGMKFVRGADGIWQITAIVRNGGATPPKTWSTQVLGLPSGEQSVHLTTASNYLVSRKIRQESSILSDSKSIARLG